MKGCNILVVVIVLVVVFAIASMLLSQDSDSCGEHMTLASPSAPGTMGWPQSILQPWANAQEYNPIQHFGHTTNKVEREDSDEFQSEHFSDTHHRSKHTPSHMEQGYHHFPIDPSRY